MIKFNRRRNKISEDGIYKKTAYDTVKKTKTDNFTFLNRKYCKTGQTVLVGDSITEICNITELFSKYTAETSLEVYNRGISGDTGDRLIDRIRDNVTSIAPSNIILLIGTNDLGYGYSADSIVMHIERILDVLQKDCPNAKIILQSIYPVNKKIDAGMVGTRMNSDIKIINHELKNISRKRNIIFADLYDRLCDADGNFNSAYTYDGLHPNAQGFEIVAREIIKLLNS